MPESTLTVSQLVQGLTGWPWAFSAKGQPLQTRGTALQGGLDAFVVISATLGKHKGKGRLMSWL